MQLTQASSGSGITLHTASCGLLEFEGTLATHESKSSVADSFPEGRFVVPWQSFSLQHCLGAASVALVRCF